MEKISHQLNGKGQFINGSWIQQADSVSLKSINPATGALFWQGCAASKEDIHSAHKAAKQALKHWASLDMKQRSKYTQEFARQVEKRRTKLAHIISEETGKPLWEANTEVSAVIGKINISIQAYEERTASNIKQQNDVTSSLSFKPHGVVVVLGAYNFPAHLSNGHIVPALLAGNTILYKPSELTPAVAEIIMECWQESGLPDGVINCLQGGADCGQELLSQDIQGVYFTGSYKTGLNIHRTFADRPEVIVALEMGGNNPLVISNHIHDINAAVYHTLISSFITAGQRCTCARRIIIPDTPFGDEFLSKLVSLTSSLKTGAYTEQPEPFMGPVISNHAASNHLNDQKELVDSGGETLLEMKLLAENTGLLSPGIIDMSDVNHPMDNEIFAPLAQIFRYENFDQALEIANQTQYGLSAGLMSDEINEYKRFFNTVKAGLINWNRPTTGASSNLPFGGIGKSGNHRPSAYFAADYCAYPVASQEQNTLVMPKDLLPGIKD